MSDQDSPFGLPSKMLVPIDGSECSSRAKAYALLLAKKFNAKVVFVHVIDFPSTGSRFALATEIRTELRKEAAQLLEESVKDAKSMGIDCEDGIIAFGDPAEEIISTLEEEACDSIVIGKRGLGGLERLLMGSVSEKVVKLSHVPVVIIK